MVWLMNNGNEAFSLDSLFKAITAAYSHSFFFIPSFCLTPAIPVSPPGPAGVFDAAHAPFFRTARQGHSQSKCMLMLCLKELPGVPSTLNPTRCGTRVSQGGGSRCEGKGGPAAKICRAVESHLTTGVDTARPMATDSMEVWMFNGAFLPSHAEEAAKRR